MSGSASVSALDEGKATPLTGESKDEALGTEVRLLGGKPATRLVHPWWAAPRDDGYCSSDSTPKGFGKFLCLLLLYETLK